MSAHPTRHLPTLHALRAFAALMVVAAHFEYAANFPALQNHTVDTSGFAFHFFSRAGSFGVDLFFYLSGFIMVHTTRGSTPDHAAQFIVKRVLRIFPAYWLCLGVFWLVLHRDAGLHDLAKAALLLPWRNVAPPQFEYSLLPVAWTLTYEMVFYLLFALAIRVSGCIRSIAAALVCGLPIIVFCAQWYVGHRLTLDPEAAPVLSGGGSLNALPGVLSNPVMLQFAIGSLCGAIFPGLSARIAQIPKWLVNGVCIAMIACACWLYWTHSTRLGMEGVSASACAAFFFGLFADCRTEASMPPSIDYLGDLSYGIYLTHQVVIDIVTACATSFWLIHDGVGGYLILAGLVLVCSSAIHHYVELPAMRLARRYRYGAATPALSR
jgi:peptidoglycan/LPS O-acetylase OafA/YrhL